MKVAIAAGILFAFFSLPVTGQVNNLVNSGFEDGISSAWSYNIINGSEAHLRGSGLDPFEGDSSLQLDIFSIGTGGPQVIGVYQDLEVLNSGEKYLVSCAVKGPAGQTFRFRVAGDSRQTKNFTVAGGGWKRYEFVINELLASGDGIYRCAVEFAFTDNVPGSWEIDAFKVEDYFSIPGNLARVFVSPEGDDGNAGSMQSPLKTVGKAFEKLGGDTIYLLEGRYHEESLMTGKSGVEGAPIVITSYPGHKVVFDGTINLDGTWDLYSGNIYRTNPGREVWQLFRGDTLLMPARWPNAFLHDGTVWDRELYWAHGNEASSSNGTAVDDPSGANDLAASGIDATGAMAVMNVGSWKTSAREVLSHSAGSNTFEYDPVTFTYKPKHHYYYLEGTLALLDAPGEWCYDTATGDIYVWVYDGLKPDGSLRGKNQSYALSFSGCKHIKVEGIAFFATTLNFTDCTHAVVENCDFSYPSSSKRALLSNAPPDVLSMKSSTANPSHNKIINSSIRNTESHAFYLEGHTNLVENCRLENIDWVVADRPQLMNSIYLSGNNNIFRRNTVSRCGASSTIYPGNFPLVEYNRVWSTGHLQSDGSITQVVINGQPGSVIQYNWFHNTVKSGARFDAPIPPTVWGHGGTMRHNVIWATGSGLMVKGEYHYCFNNTVYGTNINGIIVLDESDGGGGNVGTVTRNNISDKISGHRSNWTALPGIADHNWNGYVEAESFQSQLLDPGNLDFRPDPEGGLIDSGDFVAGHNIPFLGDAPDIGAYEHGDSIYWIAGRQLPCASSPVPADGCISNSRIIDLMFLQGYKASGHDVYFSGDSASVAGAGRGSSEYLGRISNNIADPGVLTAGECYFWRVDAVMESGEVCRGQVWSFTAASGANIPTDSVTFEIYSREAGRVEALDSAEISINGSIFYTDSTGLLNLGMKRAQYEWSVTKRDFETKTASFYSEEAPLVRDTLDRISATVIFFVTAESLPLASAEVVLGSGLEFTDDEGSVVFYAVPVQDDLQYSVSHTAYESSTGSLMLSVDTTLHISLEPLGAGVRNDDLQVRVFPNPATEKIYLDRINPVVARIRIYRIDGVLCLDQAVHSTEVTLSLENLDPGEHILVLSDSEGMPLFQSNLIVISTN